MQISSKTGKMPEQITIDEIKKGHITGEDIKISSETLLHQAEVARAANRPQMAANFRRASEMVDIPDEVLLRMYNMLRPNKSTSAELAAMAVELETRYNAKACAALVRDAVAVYEKRGLCK